MCSARRGTAQPSCNKNDITPENEYKNILRCNTSNATNLKTLKVERA